MTCAFWKMTEELNTQLQQMSNNERLTDYPDPHLEKLMVNTLFYSLTKIKTIAH